MIEPQIAVPVACAPFGTPGFEHGTGRVEGLAVTLHEARRPFGTERSDEAGPELQHMKELYRAEFKKAFAEGLAELPLEARTYLRQYYLDGLGLVQLAKLYGSSAPTVCRRLQSARGELLTATRTRLAERLKVSETELESIMRLIESRLSADALTA